MRWGAGLAALLLPLAVAGCSGKGDDQTPSPFADCSSITAQPTTAQPTTAQPTTAQPTTAQPTTAQPTTAQPTTAQPTTAQPTTAQPSTPPALPRLRLPCFTGGKQVSLADIHGPAVINFWASWCGPCRTELPVIQALANRTAGKLTVVGVDTGDRREAGASFAAAKQVTLPTLFDGDQTLFNALAGRALPMTVFVDGSGKRTIYALPLTDQTLPGQVHAHTGVTVTP